MEEKTTNNEDSSSLENGISLDGNDQPASTSSSASEPSSNKKRGGGNKVKGLITHLNVYLLLFILIIVLSGGIVLVGMQRSKKDAQIAEIKTQTLTAEAINKLKGTDAKVGDAKQTLSIESNAIFNGKVLIRDSLDVAGAIKVGGALSLPGLTVSGTSNFDQIQANNLSLSGDANIQGLVKIQKTLNVTGTASFGGPITAPQITVQALQLVGDLQFNRHIDAGGGTPSHSAGTALGSGGTVSLSGTDTAGTVTINTGGSPAAGCFINVTFTQKFNSTPHLVATPVGSAGAGLSYYVNRTSSGFSICTTNPAPGSASFGFDYVAVD